MATANTDMLNNFICWKRSTLTKKHTNLTKSTALNGLVCKRRVHTFWYTVSLSNNSILSFCYNLCAHHSSSDVICANKNILHLIKFIRAHAPQSASSILLFGCGFASLLLLSHAYAAIHCLWLYFFSLHSDDAVYVCVLAHQSDSCERCAHQTFEKRNCMQFTITGNGICHTAFFPSALESLSIFIILTQIKSQVLISLFVQSICTPHTLVDLCTSFYISAMRHGNTMTFFKTTFSGLRAIVCAHRIHSVNRPPAQPPARPHCALVCSVFCVCFLLFSWFSFVCTLSITQTYNKNIIYCLLAYE